ncbi:hypothetical protein AHAS_Ahas06G0173200 [Arachis hypogaea]
MRLISHGSYNYYCCCYCYYYYYFLRQATKNLLPRKLNPPETYNEITTAVLASIGFIHISRIDEVKGHSALLSALVEQ